MSASEAGGAAPQAPATTIRSNSFAPKPMAQPNTENQRNPLVSCSRDMVCLPSRRFALAEYGPPVNQRAYQKNFLVSANKADENEGRGADDEQVGVCRYVRRGECTSTLSSAPNCKL